VFGSYGKFAGAVGVIGAVVVLVAVVVVVVRALGGGVGQFFALIAVGLVLLLVAGFPASSASLEDAPALFDKVG
jgi:hypothetical protein